MHAPVSPVYDDDDDEDEYGGVFLHDSDVIHEVSMDSEDLPDADADADDGSQEEEGDDDDGIYKFTSHYPDEDFVDQYKSIHECSMDTEIEDEKGVCAVACSPTDATLVATGGCDDRGFLWRIGQDDFFEIHDSLAFSYDGQLLASGSLDGIVKVWGVSGNWEGKTLEGPGGDIEWLRWHPRGHILLAGFLDSTVRMWNTDRSSLLNTFTGHSHRVTCGDFTPDGKKICTGSDDATMRIWNPRSGESIYVVKGHSYHDDGLTCLAISSTSTLALTGSKDGSVHIVHIPTGRVVDNGALGSHADSVECVGFAPSDSWAAVGGMDKRLIIWDVEHLLSRGTCEHEDGVTCLSWLGASCVATGGCDGKVRLWDSRSGECVKTFKGQTNVISSLSVSANGNYLVSDSYDGTARAFEVGNFR
ncbi:angio-associated migratory cell protein-like [Abrus precatorius]|uniref:Angio-associated migratory cell protein-like n=1 Tax=Abrus precatorius TaxID=3816 RepID=A0A8B8MFH5_ABRPR|nr:angio-associated migratory cell protein-like [Abrus precatorius]